MLNKEEEVELRMLANLIFNGTQSPEIVFDPKTERGQHNLKSLKNGQVAIDKLLSRHLSK